VLLLFPEPGPRGLGAVGIDAAPFLEDEKHGPRRMRAMIDQFLLEHRTPVALIALIAEAWEVRFDTEGGREKAKAAGLTPGTHPARIETIVVAYEAHGVRAISTHVVRRPPGAPPILERGQLHVEDQEFTTTGSYFMKRNVIH
jgi:hypothetical protein